MKKDLLFEFDVDKTARTVFITREFAARLPLVWDTFTKPDLLDQWTAPKPWSARTVAMDFQVGGRRFYAMVGPDGHEMFQVQKYVSITPRTDFSYVSAFCDKDENVDAQWPGSVWDLNFSEENGTTTVKIKISNESQARFEKMLELGFQAGFTMTMENLENLLLSKTQ